MIHWMVWALLLLLLAGGLALVLFSLRLRRQAQAQRRELRSLYGVAESMISAVDLSEICKRIVKALPLIVNASHCYLFLHNRVGKQLDVLAGTDKYPVPSVPLEGVSGPVMCFKNNSLLEVPDAATCPFLDAAIVRTLGQKSVLFVPMHSEGEIFGVLEIEDRGGKRRFSEEQKACAQHVASLGALAMKLCEQRSMREQLYRTEKLAAVGELISGVAHELKSPLGSMAGLTELALARHKSGPLASELRAIQAEAQHATAILQRLISFARPQQPGPKLVDLNAVLRSVLVMREPKWREGAILCRLQLAPAAAMVNSEPAQLEQVFMNLLINAEQALQQAREKVITVRTTMLPKRVLISISDTGVGLSPELQNPGYGLFFDHRRAGGSAGLGLAVCKGLIESHGGSIRVINSPGQTTTFEIEYPLSVFSLEQAASGLAGRPARQGMPAGLTALVIDEDRHVQDSLLSLLSDRRYRVITVSSAEEALDLAERVRFDLVLCEVRLRGISGIELYKRLQHQIRSFVFLTTDAFHADLREMFSEHNQAVLGKPFTSADVERLLEEIEPLLMGSHAGETAQR